MDIYNANNFQVGDIIEATFQYNSRHPAFYKVVRRTPSTIYTKALDTYVVSHDGYGQNGLMMPLCDTFASDKVFTSRINKKRGTIRIADCLGHIWDGEPSAFYTD